MSNEMSRIFTYWTKETASADAQPLITRSLQNYGFLPKLHAVLAQAPAAYQAYLDTFALFEQHSSFTALEQQVVFMTANYENNCHYCVPGHSFLMQHKGMPAAVIEALREGKVIPDAKLQALREYTRLLIEKRGHLSTAEINAFLAAGYDQRQALEVLVGLASKLISNFTNALAHTELDEAVKPFAWTHPDQRNATSVLS